MNLPWTWLADGWLQIKIPLPYSLKWVNAYLLPGEDGWTLIDPGLRTPEAEAVWVNSLADLQIGWDLISRIIITHHHPDHFGLAGWIQERTGAPAWMSGTALAAAKRMWGEGETYSKNLLEAFRDHGLPAELAAEMEIHLLGFRQRVTPMPEKVNRLEPGGVFRMAGRVWDVLGGEGHAPGHLLFYDPDGGKLLCGDQVIPDISPNIGWMPGGDPDPLGSFLETMRGLLRLDVTVAYPGHREPFTGVRERVSGLIGHHERRLEKIEELIGKEAATSFEICEQLFGVHLRGNSHNLRFALAETLAHMVYLERRGRLKIVDGGATPVVRYGAFV